MPIINESLNQFTYVVVLLSSNMFSGALPQDQMAKCQPADNISDATIARSNQTT